jgi:hypothetical protein
MLFAGFEFSFWSGCDISVDAETVLNAALRNSTDYKDIRLEIHGRQYSKDEKKGCAGRGKLVARTGRKVGVPQRVWAMIPALADALTRLSSRLTGILRIYGQSIRHHIASSGIAKVTTTIICPSCMGFEQRWRPYKTWRRPSLTPLRWALFSLSSSPS